MTLCWAYGSEPDMFSSLDFLNHGINNRGTAVVQLFPIVDPPGPGGTVRPPTGKFSNIKPV